MTVPAVLGAARFPQWEPHPDVWLVVGLLAVAYAIAVTRVGPRSVAPGQRTVTRAQVMWFSSGLLALLVASDWPVHDIAEKSMYSVHMMQHLTFTLLAAPLLLMGTPGWMLRAVLRPEPVFKAVRFLARFLPAIIVFNLVLVVSHWPAVVDLTLHNGFAHFLAHAVILVSAIIVWMPVLSPLPEIPRLSPLIRMLFLFSQSVVPTVPASFLTFGSKPLYKFYVHVPHLWGVSTLQDQLIAGLIMKIAGGLLLWMAIAVIWFRWSADEERNNRATREWRVMDRELTGMGLTTNE